MSIQVTEDGGVVKTITQEGAGEARPAPGSKVFVHYTGRLHDGSRKVFDSSVERGTPFSFDLGKGSVIKGWDIGVATMTRGEKATFVLQSDYAYGKTGAGKDIPPNATLEFDVELLRWVEGEEVTDDGLVTKVVDSAGSGWLKPKDGEDVVVSYRGTTSSGTVVDESSERKVVRLGSGELEKGLEETIKSMTKGEVCRATILPPHSTKGENYQVTLHSWIQVVKVGDGEGVTKRIQDEPEGYKKPNGGATCTFDIVGRNADGSVVFDKRTAVKTVLDKGCNDVPDVIEDTLATMKEGEHSIVEIESHCAVASQVPEAAQSLIKDGHSLFYDLRLTHFEKVLEPYEIAEDADKLAFAEEWKETAKTHFKAGNLGRAGKCYSKSVKAVDNLLSKSGVDETVVQGVRELVKTVYINLAVTHSKLKQHTKAIENAGKALEIDGRNVKALYRRSVAYSSIGDLEKAERDLHTALEVEPESATIKTELKNLAAKVKAQEQKDKQMFKKMF